MKFRSSSLTRSGASSWIIWATSANSTHRLSGTAATRWAAVGATASLIQGSDHDEDRNGQLAKAIRGTRLQWLRQTFLVLRLVRREHIPLDAVSQCAAHPRGGLAPAVDPDLRLELRQFAPLLLVPEPVHVIPGHAVHCAVEIRAVAADAARNARERGDTTRSRQREIQSNRTSERLADNVRSVDAEMVEECGDVRPIGELDMVGRAAAEPTHVTADNAVAAGERLRLEVPHAQVPEKPVDEHQCFARAFDLVVEIAAVDGEESCGATASGLVHGSNLARQKDNRQHFGRAPRTGGCQCDTRVDAGGLAMPRPAES